MRGSGNEITRLLVAWSEGDERVLERLTALVYTDLHRLAKRYMASERPDHTLQPTALVNEVFLRLVPSKEIQWQNRSHFFALSAKLMRRILIDSARSRRYGKRGGGASPVSLDEAIVGSKDEMLNTNLVRLDDALSELQKVDPRKSQIVELRFFGGLSVEETANLLNVSTQTVMRDWSFAKAWLMRKLNGDSPKDFRRVG